MMKERTLRVLEFTKIRDRLSACAATGMGAEKCLALEPMERMDDVLRAQDETEEATVVLTYLGASPLIPFDDVRSFLTLAEKGAQLSQKALLQTAGCLRAAKTARDSLVTERKNTPLLTARAEGLQPFTRLEREITDSILSEEEIADNASPALADIRRHIRLANEHMREKLASMARGGEIGKYLQENIVTVRDGRYVIPVKQEFRQFVPGLVHDQSSSGATLFIEPMAVVELGNELKQWTVRERVEIDRILSELSAKVGEQAGLIQNNLSILIHLDFAFAKGRMARDMSAIQPKMNEAGYIRLVRVRHPLIPRENVVPCDLWMGKEFTTLIITGPNTGGKTVTLKTVGLMTLMAQAGLHVPGDLGTELSVFNQVYADIGDEQSIEQSLSTFSSHMTNIVEIVKNVTPRDLVLFDELGAGTDPTEGAALAQTILSRLLKKKVRTVATTHYSELKAYGLSVPGVENASVEFDVQTLRPTYRLSIGVPGKSNAFDISRKLGLPDDLIGDAKQLLSQNDIRFEDVIASAEYNRQVAAREREAAERAQQDTSRLRAEAEALYKDMEEKRQSAARKAKDEARRILDNARRESESILSELRQMKNTGRSDQQANELKRRLENGIDALSEGLSSSNPTLTPPPKTLKQGDEVDVLHLGTSGTVLSTPDAKGEVQLQVGILKLKAHISQLRIRKEQSIKQKSVVKTHTGAGSRTVHMECDVRGMALDEALPEVERYLDEAVMAGLNEVTIIHGKGTGVLRTGIQRSLKTYPHVKACRNGQFGEGEDGVTVVTLN